MGSMKVSEFLGGAKKSKDVAANKKTGVSPKSDAVPSGDVPLEILKHKLMDSDSIKEKIALKKEIRDMIQQREFLKNELEQIVRLATTDSDMVSTIMTKRTKLTEFSCYEKLVKTFSRRCFQLSKVSNHS